MKHLLKLIEMKIVHLSIFLLYCALAQGQKHDSSNQTRENIYKVNSPKAKVNLSYADFLENALHRGSWDVEDQPCLTKLYKTIEDARNNTLYAVWMLDSMQMIPNGQLFGNGLHLTNYDECLNRHWMNTHPNLNTQYCLAEVKLSESKKRKDYIPDPEDSTDVYLKTRTPEDLDLTIMNWGLCLPEKCPKTTAAKIFRVLLESSHLRHLADEATINIDSCKIAGENNLNHDAGDKLRYLMNTLIVIAVWSTYYTMNHKLNPKSYVHEIIRSFCMKRNIHALTSVNEDEIHILNIMRLISCMLVVTGHYMQHIMTRRTVSGLVMDRNFGEQGAMQRHANLVVDTFFTISGLLLARGYFTGSWSNPIKFLIKRYMRLFGLLSLVMYVRTYILYNLGDGPLWDQTVGADQKICQAYFLHTFTTLNNYMGIDKLCYLVSWSSSADYQMSVLAVILCMIYGRNRRNGIIAFIATFLATNVISTYVTYVNKLPPVFNYGLEAAGNLRENIVFQKIYMYTHTRTGPFLVGMALGYIIANYRPAEYRKRISRRASYIYLTVCLAAMINLVELGGTYYYRNPEAPGFAIFGGVNRSVHAIIICAIIGIFEYGDLGVLYDFFKLSPIITLGRLTYGVYLIHYAIVLRLISFARTGVTTDTLGFTIASIGITVISFMYSFVLSLLVEAPINNVVNILLDGPRALKSKGKTNLNAPGSNGHITNSNGHIKTTTNGVEDKYKKDEQKESKII